MLKYPKQLDDHHHRVSTGIVTEALHKFSLLSLPSTWEVEDCSHFDKEVREARDTQPQVPDPTQDQPDLSRSSPG